MKRAAILAVCASTGLIEAAYGSALLPAGPHAWAPWALMLGTAGILVAMMVLGAARQGRIGRLRYPFAFVLVVLTVGFGAALALPAADPGDPTLWLGLPPRAAVILYGIGILPFLVVPVAYALTFDRNTLTPDDWARVVAAARERRSHEEDAR